jgi:predicted lipoprotein with Yx(FWY)xxD motif
MTTRRRERRGLIATSLVALAAAVVIGNPTVAWATTPTVLVTTNATFGPVLTTGSGFALYTLDTDHNGQSTCHGGCAAVWPPLTVPSGTVPSRGPGVTGTVGVSLQTNGTDQVTYNGSPLYSFVSDTAPGQVTGNGISGFFVATVAPATTTTTTTAPSSPAGGVPTTGAAPPTGSSTSSAPLPVSKSPAPTTASATGSSAPGATSTTPGALAFTGSGVAVRWLFRLGLLLVTVGSLVTVAAARRARRPAS